MQSILYSLSLTIRTVNTHVIHAAIIFVKEGILFLLKSMHNVIIYLFENNNYKFKFIKKKLFK